MRQRPPRSGLKGPSSLTRRDPLDHLHVRNQRGSRLVVMAMAATVSPFFSGAFG